MSYVRFFYLDTGEKTRADVNYDFSRPEPSHVRTPKTERWKREVRMEEMRTLFEKQPRFWTCGKLAVRYGVSRQQIARDVAKLRRRGIAVQSSQRGYYLDTPDENPFPN
ncbi:MAG: helix-turn-helix domain-containing protein [bacterium]